MIEGSSLKEGGHTTDEPLARILDVAGCIKECADRLRLITRDLRTQVSQCIEVGGGTLGTLL